MHCPANKANKAYKERERVYTKRMVNEQSYRKQCQCPSRPIIEFMARGRPPVLHLMGAYNCMIVIVCVLSFGRPLPRTSRLG
jgi:hypothetical protein